MNKLLLLLVLFSFNIYATEPVNKSYWGDVAINGKDSIAYHSAFIEANSNPNKTQLPALKGKSDYNFKYKGANWRFGSQAALDKFANNPSKYQPEFNGFCANALSLGKGLVKTDGTKWGFFNDKLYLFYAAGGRQSWVDSSDIMQNIALANQAWQVELK